MGKYICGDCLDVMKTLDGGSVNLVITSPPYADQIKNYGPKAEKVAPDRFVEWFIPRAKEIYRLLAEDGSFVLNISDKLVGKYQDLFQQHPYRFYIAKPCKQMQRCGCTF